MEHTTNMKEKISIFWFRRDLRLEDNVGLFYALSGKYKVYPIFIFDKEILSKLPKNDARVAFIHEALQKMQTELNTKFGSNIALFHDSPKNVFQQLIKNHEIDTVYTNHDYEPYARERDAAIAKILKESNIQFNTYKDQVIFEKNEILKKDGQPYKVYTPYMRVWKETFRKQEIQVFNSEELLHNSVKANKYPNVTLASIGFEKPTQKIQAYSVTASFIKAYEETRNYPAQDTTSRLGPHLRFGTVSIRKMIKKAIAHTNETFWQELIWREFFMQILWHFPHTHKSAFKEKYDRIEWRNNEEEFEKWCKGETGYPLVDAGMRQLNETGFMHNRIRMLVGSFLCKHLLIDWKWGEAYFAEKLHDYEMASNVGNWQWVAGSGVDASPYFRIFNPTTQIKKFDKDLKYIKKWVKDINEFSYPKEIVDHKEARERCLRVYKEAVS